MSVSRVDGSVIVGTVIVLFGIVLLFNSLGMVTFNFWQWVGRLWPVLLIAFGAWLLIGARQVAGDAKIGTTYSQNMYHAHGNEEYQGILIGDIRVAGLPTLEGLLQRKLILGDIVADLRSTILATGTNRLELSTLFGDIDVVVPSGIVLQVQLSSLLGEVSCDGRQEDGFVSRISFADDQFVSAASKLTIEAKTLVGDIRVVRSKT